MALDYDCNWIKDYTETLPRLKNDLAAAKAELETFKKTTRKDNSAIKAEITLQIEKEIARSAADTQQVAQACIREYKDSPTGTFDAYRFLRTALPVPQALIESIVDASFREGVSNALSEAKYNEKRAALQAKVSAISKQIKKLETKLSDVDTFEAKWRRVQTAFSTPCDMNGYAIDMRTNVGKAWKVFNLERFITRGRPEAITRQQEEAKREQLTQQIKAQKTGFLDGVFKSWRK